MNRIGRHPMISIALLALHVAGCKAPEDGIFTPEAGDMGDTGIFMPAVDLPAEGEPDVPLPTGLCIQEPEPGLFGYWHQCFGELQVDFVATHDDKQHTGGDLLRFGPGRSNPKYWTDPDSYDLPLVAACCGPYDYQNPTTEQKIPYINNCLFDAVQQLCIGMPHFLRKQAEQTDLGDGKLALEWLAGKIESNTSDCVGASGKADHPAPTVSSSMKCGARAGRRQIHPQSSRSPRPWCTTGRKLGTCPS